MWRCYGCERVIRVGGSAGLDIEVGLCLWCRRIADVDGCERESEIAEMMSHRFRVVRFLTMPAGREWDAINEL